MNKLIKFYLSQLLRIIILPVILINRVLHVLKHKPRLNNLDLFLYLLLQGNESKILLIFSNY